MLVAYKVVIPETGKTYRFAPDEYAAAMAKWHEEIAWLDCDTYLMGLHADEQEEAAELVQWYLRDLAAFSCPPNCSRCPKFAIPAPGSWG
jgi:hypothetical protein